MHHLTDLNTEVESCPMRLFDETFKIIPENSECFRVLFGLFHEILLILRKSLYFSLIFSGVFGQLRAIC
jgi:hypothetical protein